MWGTVLQVHKHNAFGQPHLWHKVCGTAVFALLS